MKNKEDHEYEITHLEKTGTNGGKKRPALKGQGAYLHLKRFTITISA